MEWIEILGWIGNGCVVIQFLMRDMWKLRIWGIIAATLWLIYGIGINSWPLISMNVLIWVIQAYHLIKLSKERRMKIKKSTGKKFFKDRHGS